MEDPNADTEWNDILRAHGILPPKQDPTEDEMEVTVPEQDTARLDEKTLDELDELEDDDRVILEYRKKRIAEMKAETARAKYGEMTQISKPDFVSQVTEASKEVWVIVHLFKNDIPECKLMNAHLLVLAARHKSTKFVKIIGDQCIQNYPDQNMPTLLIYGEGDLKEQVVGLTKFGGMGMTLEALENFLKSVGAIEQSYEAKSKQEDAPHKKIYGKDSALSDDDDFSD